jgi:hypothetical protein
MTQIHTDGKLPNEAMRSTRQFKAPGSKFNVCRNFKTNHMSPLGTFDVRTFAPWRLCVSHSFRTETIGDSCNSSLQFLRNEPNRGQKETDQR